MPMVLVKLACYWNNHLLLLCFLLSEIYYVLCTLVDPSGRTSHPARYPEQFDQHHPAFGADRLYARE